MSLTQAHLHGPSLNVMTVVRLLSTGARSAALILLGSGLIFAPLALALSGPAILTGVFVGAAMMGLGVSGTDSTGRGTLPISAHAIYDRVVALGLLAAAVAFGLLNQDAALALFGAGGLAVLAVALTTKYSLSRA